MMNRKKYPALFAFVLSVVALLSCNREEPVTNGRIAISFSTGELLTRAVGNGVVADGGGIAIDAGGPDIVVALADRTKTIVAWYPTSFPSTPLSNGYTSEVYGTPTSTESTVLISGPGRGTYTAYAIGNSKGLSETKLNALKAATTIDDLEAIELEVSGDPAVPTFLQSRMPITAKGSITVNQSGNGQADLELLRPVSRVELYFIDQTDEETPLKLFELEVKIYKMNPTKGYLFPKDPDKGTGSLNNLVFIGDDLELSSNPTTPTITGKLVFPSTAPEQTLGNRYYCDISFRVEKKNQTYSSSNSATYTSYEYEGLPIHDYRSDDLQFLKRNQLLKINTRITKRGAEHDVSFWFEVASWVSRTETIEFN